MLYAILPCEIVNYMIIPYLPNIEIINNIQLFDKTTQEKLHHSSKIIQSFFKSIVPSKILFEVIEKYPTRKGLAILYGLYYPTEFVTNFHSNMYFKKKNLLYTSNPWLTSKETLKRSDLYNAILNMPVEHTLYIGW